MPDHPVPMLMGDYLCGCMRATSIIKCRSSYHEPPVRKYRPFGKVTPPIQT